MDNFTYDLPNYTSNHQKRSDRKGGGVSVYIHNSFNVKTRSDLSTNCRDIESLTLEIISEKTRNTIVSVLYRPPNGHFEHFENFLTNFFLNTKDSNKNVYIAGDFSLNLLDHSLNKKVQYYLNLIYQNSFIPTVNKPTRVTRKTSTIIDHILTNLFVNTNFKTFIFKIDISDHFPICFLQPTSRPREENEVTYITKRVINNNAIELFKQELYKTSWDDVINNKNPNDAYNYFSHKHIILYDKYFPKQNIRIYNKDLQSLWITRRIKKSSKHKQNLYLKFLKIEIEKMSLNKKNIRNFLSRSKNVQKRITFPA